MSVRSKSASLRRLEIAATVVAGMLTAGFSGCDTPEIMKPDSDNRPVMITSAEGFSTREVIYRGWDHCFRVSDGSVEMIFVPSVGRLMRFAPVEPGVEAPTTASALANTAAADDKNLCWVNPKWTGINPSPFDPPVHDHPRDYRLYGGLRHWAGPQEKWPSSRAPDLRKLIDVDIAWPPDPGCDLMPFKYISGDAGKVRFESTGRTATGLRASVEVEVMAANKGVLNFHYAQTNKSTGPVEASSWVAMTLRQRGYLAIRRDQLKAEPEFWPAGTQFADPWAVLPLDSRPERELELAIEPGPDVTGHVVILHEQSIYSMQVKRVGAGNYPPDRSVLTVKRGVIGCPPQLELADPESDEHYEIAACSPLVTLNPDETVELNLRMVSKSVRDFDVEKLKQYLVSAVATETIPPLPTPRVSGQSNLTTAPVDPRNNPTVTPPHSGDETIEYPPPLPGPEPGESPSPRPPTQGPGPKPQPIDPNKPPPMGPVNG
jgi:hypothetical protein